MRYFTVLLVLCVLGGLSACTYTKKDSAGRVEKISREEYQQLRD